MKTFIPELHVQFAYKSIKMGTTFIKHLKRSISKLNFCNCVYQFICPCAKSYKGRTKRVLRIRAQEHLTFSRAKKTYYYLHRCPTYVWKLLEYEENHLTSKSGAAFQTKLRDEFFMGYLKILQKTSKPIKTFATPKRTSNVFFDRHLMIKTIIKISLYFKVGQKN